MKKHILIAAFTLFASLTAVSQTAYPPTPEYEYAMLRANDKAAEYILQYSNSNEKVHLEDKLHIPLTSENFTFSQARFLCFKYLNTQGYELVSSGPGFEYIFKRLKK